MKGPSEVDGRRIRRRHRVALPGRQTLANHNARCLAVGRAQPKDPAICHAQAGSRERAYLGRCRRPSQRYRLAIPRTFQVPRPISDTPNR